MGTARRRAGIVLGGIGLGPWLRRFSRRTERITVVEDQTDAHAVEGHPGRAPDPEAELKRKIRSRGFAVGVTTLVLAGSLAALFSSGGYLDLRRLRREFETRKLELEQTRARVLDLERDVDRLEHDSSARERIAREQLGLVRPGEIDFLLPREPEVGGENGKEPSSPPDSQPQSGLEADP